MDSNNERVLAYDMATTVELDEQETEAISGGFVPFRMAATLEPTTFNYMSFDLNLDH